MRLVVETFTRIRFLDCRQTHYVKDIKVVELKTMLPKRALSTAGSKAELKSGLIQVVEAEEPDPDTYVFESDPEETEEVAGMINTL